MAQTELWRCRWCQSKFVKRPGRFCPVCREEKSIDLVNNLALHDALISLVCTTKWDELMHICFESGYHPRSPEEMVEDIKSALVK